MSNRTDFDAQARELSDEYGFTAEVRDRIETELHNAYVAGEEGGGCECSSCRRLGVDGYRAPKARHG